MAPILLLMVLTSFTTTAMVSTVCDCTKTSIGGRIDTQVPDYCILDQDVRPKARKLNYKLITTTREEMTWKGYSCSTLTHKENNRIILGQ